jgi:phage shock protein A
MMRRVVSAALCAAVVLSFSLAARAEEPGENPLVVADRIERDAQALLAQGRCGEGARLMSKAWRLRAEAWGAEMRPEPHPPMPPGGPAMPRPPRGPRLDTVARKAPHFYDELHFERDEVSRKIGQLKAQSNELEQAAKAAMAAGDEAKAREKLEHSRRMWAKAEELEKALREGGERKHERADATAEHKARLAEAHEKLRRMQAEVEEWAAKAKALAANGHEKEAAEASAKAKEAAERAEHLKQRLAGAAGTPPKDVRAERGALESEVRRLRAEVEELKAHLEKLRQHLESQKR